MLLKGNEKAEQNRRVKSARVEKEIENASENVE
jgi:hypothetical protein